MNLQRRAVWRNGMQLLVGAGAVAVAGCRGDDMLAPEALMSKTTPSVSISPQRESAELLVLVDERGVARRALVVRNERDPRRRKIEQLGFRFLGPTAVSEGGVDAVSRALFAPGQAKGLAVTYLRSSDRWSAAMDRAVNAVLPPGQAKGLAVTYLRSSDRWSAAMDRAVNAVLPPGQATRERPSFKPKERRDIVAGIAEVEDALKYAEGTIDLALSVTCSPVSAEPSANTMAASAYISEAEAADCSVEKRNALVESSEFALAATAMIGSLEACGATLGLACFAVVPLYVLYQKEGGEMVEASNKLLTCLRKP